jgi:hypothetical protein
MTQQEIEALALVIDIAVRWAENAEEAFASRVTPDASDEACQNITDYSQSSVELADVIEVRNLWRAVDVLAPPLIDKTGRRETVALRFKG